MKSKFTWRAYVIIFFLLVCMGGLLWRLLDLSFFNRRFLLQQSDARILRIVAMPAHRGMIADRTGSVLALSSPVYSAWINPKDFQPSYQQLAALSKILHMRISTIEARADASKKAFVYLDRRNPPEVMARAKALNIAGLHFEMDYQRFYPEGEAAAQVLGRTNIDDQGQEGLELAYNNWLSGIDGRKEVIRDRYGHIVSEISVLKQPKQGRDLNLSIDHRIQYIAYRALKEAVEDLHASSGSVIVLDVNTGEVLAMANMPSYNPNDLISQENGSTRNRAATDSFEPGSTMKPFTITAALQSGLYKPTTMINTHPGYMRVGGYEIKDDFVDNGIIDLQTILEVSSNIGAAKIILSLSPPSVWGLLRSFGFGSRTSSGFPGESQGTLIDHEVWYKSEVATLAYGYGVSVTALQLVHAYAILAAHGMRYPITFIKQDTPPKGTRVIPAKIADEVDQMLQSVVTGKRGTGGLAAVPGYTVAGKTGTAYIAGPNGYDKKKYIGDFVGFAPASNPRIVIAVIIRDPKNKRNLHFGGEVAAPVFSKVMSATLRLLNVAPDNVK